MCTDKDGDTGYKLGCTRRHRELMCPDGLAGSKTWNHPRRVSLQAPRRAPRCKRNSSCTSRERVFGDTTLEIKLATPDRAESYCIPIETVTLARNTSRERAHVLRDARLHLNAYRA